MLLFSPLSLWSACATECPEGTHEDGPVCIADVATEAGPDISASLRACTAAEGGGEIDLVNACVEDVCVGDTYADVVDRLGTPQDISAWVQWASGVGVDFDPEGDPPPDEAVAVEIWLVAPYAGRTTNGLGIDVPMSCFIDALGLPDIVDLWTVGNYYVPFGMYWSGPNLSIFDEDVLTGGADNVVDTLTYELDE